MESSEFSTKTFLVESCMMLLCTNSTIIVHTIRLIYRTSADINILSYKKKFLRHHLECNWCYKEKSYEIRMHPKTVVLLV